MKKTLICQGCWEQLRMPIAIRGPFSYFFKPFGIVKSRMNPNLCTLCESHFTKLMKQKQITTPITVLFADIRGYTSLSQHIDPAKLNSLLHRFYDQCSSAVWDNEGIVNKFIGDAVLAIFNFPLFREVHISNAVNAALQLQRSCVHLKEEIGLGEEDDPGVGIGITTGDSSMGEVGTTYKDFTAIGPVVNLASRLQGAAHAGEILVTAEVYNIIKDRFPAAQKRMLTLKGFDNPVEGYVIVG
jgi:adenylate cyclase